MENLKYKIVADSSADRISTKSVEYASAPLKIVTSAKEYTDDATLDVDGMVSDLLAYSGKSSTSCPNTSDWLGAFGDAERVFCVTITATLSGSYNSACLAKKIYEEEHPDRKVYVINSLSTGPEMKIIIEKLEELILAGVDYEQIIERIEKYTKHTGLLFMLESMKNLANNGRVSPLVAKFASFLGIRVVGKASDKGDLEQLDKCRGEKRALDVILDHLKKLGYVGEKLRIAHCINPGAAEKLKALVLSVFPKADVEVYKCGGLCSFYAERGGMLIGFEKCGATV